MSRINAPTSPPAPVAPAADEPLLSPGFVRKLDALDVLSRKILQGKMQGERRSKRRGQSVEFADYRAYVPGDDLRFIDWNLYARMEKLFLRLFMEEEDLLVSILVDVSASMHHDAGKWRQTLRLAAALGYIALVNYNRLSVLTFAGDLGEQLPNLRGRRPIPQLLEFLRKLTPRPGRGDLPAAARRFALQARGKGVVILLSDLLDKGDFSSALRYLCGERFDTYIIHLLSPQELDPEKAGVAGDLRLQDVEDGQVAEISASAALLKRYQADLQAYCEGLRTACAKRGAVYVRSDTSEPFEALVLRHLRRRGMLG